VDTQSSGSNLLTLKSPERQKTKIHCLASSHTDYSLYARTGLKGRGCVPFFCRVVCPMDFCSTRRKLDYLSDFQK
jgi:hypothetical protein